MMEKLVNEALPLEDRLQAAAGLKELRLEAMFSSNYPTWLETFFKPCCEVLRKVPPQFQNTAQHKLRASVLELLNHLPQNEGFKPHAPEMFELCLSVVHTDNQDNSLIATKILFDMLKAFKAQMEPQAEQFLELVTQLYKGLGEVVKNELGEHLATGPPPPYATHGSVALTGSKSFRLIQELPLPVMFLAQMYPKLGAAYQERVMLLMLEACKIPGPLPQAIHPSLTPVYMDLRTAQVKSLSYLGHMLRALKQEVSPAIKHELISLPDALVHLLRMIPEGSLASRKEVLAATRHLLNTPYRDILRNKLDELLDEGLLLGSSPLASESLRPLACQVLVELVHFARKSLSPPQLIHCINLLASISASGGLPPSVHIMCVRVVLGLTESVFPVAKTPNVSLDLKLKARSLVTLVLDCLVSKLKGLRQQASKLLAEVKAERVLLERQKQAVSQPKVSAETGTLSKAEDGQECPLTLSALQVPGEREKDLLDAKAMINIILSSIKPTIYIIMNYSKVHEQSMMQMAQHQGQVQPLEPEPHAGMPIGFTEVEIRLMSRLWSYSLFVLRLTSFEADPRAVCEKFVEMFSQMDARDFVEMVSCRLNDLFNALLEDADLLHVVAHLLAHSPNQGIQRAFLMLLLDFLVKEKLELLADLSTKQGSTTLKLFKLVFAAFPTLIDLEPAVAPQLVHLLERCLRLVVTEEHPAGYLQLMRSIFKLVMHASAQLKTLHADLAPFVQPCLVRFLAMLNGPNTGPLRPLLVELCLTLPAQLNSLIPLMPRLARPLLNALTQGPDELMLMGLRILEVWVDNINPEYIEVVIADVVSEFMGALWALLRPGSPLATKALYILGKLGGRNRRFLKEPLKLKYKENPEYGLRLILTFKPGNSFLTPLDTCMALAKAALFSSTPLGDVANDLYYRQQALRFLQISLASVLNLRGCESPRPPAPPPTLATKQDPGAGSAEPASSQAAGAAAAPAAGAGLQPTAPTSSTPPSTAPAAGVPTHPATSATPPSAAAAATPATGAPSAGAAADPSVSTAMHGAPAQGAAGAAPGVKRETGPGESTGGGDEGEGNKKHPNTEMTVDALLEVLLGKGYNTQDAPPPTSKLEQGVKTKTQLVAERSVLVTLLGAVIGASADKKLAPIAGPFSRDICRHFGMLFASNKEPPPPAPAMYRHQHDSFHAAMPQGLRELDHRLFLDALVEVLSDKVETRAKAALSGLSVFLDTVLTLHDARARLKAVLPPEQQQQQQIILNQAQGGGVDAASGVSGSQGGAQPPANQPPTGSSQPQPELMLSQHSVGSGVLVQVPSNGSQPHQPASASHLVAGLAPPGAAPQQQPSQQQLGSQPSMTPSQPSALQQQGALVSKASGLTYTGGAPQGQQQSQQPMEGVEGLDSTSSFKRGGESGGAGSGRHGKPEREHPASLLGLPPVIDDVMGRVLHCCSDECWQARLAGAAALQLLLAHPQLPPAYLTHWAAHTTRALLWVVRGLPDHCVAEATKLDASLYTLLRKALLEEQVPIACEQENGLRDAKGHDGQAEGHVDATGHGAERNDSQKVKAEREGGGRVGTKKGTEPQPFCPTPGQFEPVVAGQGPEAMQMDGETKYDHEKLDAEEAHPLAPPATREASWVRDLGTMLLSYIANPASSSRMRKSAVGCLELLAKCINTSVTKLAAAHVEKHSKELTSRRLLPFKNVEYTVGAAEALSFFLRLSPPVLSWSPELSLIVTDALELAKLDEAVLLSQLPPSRSVTPQSLTCVRVACMHMLCGLVMLDDAHEAAAEKERARVQKETADTQAEEGKEEGAQAMQVDSKQGDGQPPAATAEAAANSGPGPDPAAPQEATPARAAAGTAPTPQVAAGDARPPGGSGAADGPAAASAADAPAAASAADEAAKAERARSAAQEKKQREGAEMSEDMRGKLATMFFNNLTSSTEDIWMAAKAGVSTLLLAHNKVAKNILHTGLLPLLTSFKSHWQLTLPILQGMARLLEMLSEWFSNTLGKRSLEHLCMWMPQEGPAGKGGTVAWRPGEEAAVAAHLLELFHLLPRQAAVFLETHEDEDKYEIEVGGKKEIRRVPKSRLGLVVLTIELEERLANLRLMVPAPRVMTSPYREPLTRFLNKYSSEAVAYFLDLSRICNDRYLSRLLDIVRTPVAQPLLQQLLESEDRFLPLVTIGCQEACEATGQPPLPTPSTEDANALALHEMLENAAPYNAIHLLAVMVKLRPSWIASQHKLAAALRARWNSKARIERVVAKEDVLGRSQLLESKRLAKCMLSFVHHDRKDVSPLFDLVSITLLRSVVSFAFLEDFCKRTVPEQWSVEEKHGLLTQFVTAFKEQLYSPDHLERIMQMLVMPVAAYSLENKQLGIFDEPLVKSLCTHLLGLGESPAKAPKANGPDMTELDAALAPSVKIPSQSDNMLMELLRLATHILNHASDLYIPWQQQLLAFGWHLVKRDNAAVASQAYLLLAYYMHRFPMPDDVAMQVFGSMLRCMQPDTKKPVLRDAIDIVLPVLHKREASHPLPSNAGTPSKPEKGAMPDGPQADKPKDGGADAGAVAEGEKAGWYRGPGWVRTVKKVLTEESASLAHVAHMWQVVLRHADLFYPHRAQFASSMVHSLLRLGLQQGTTTENRKLSLDLSMLLIGWEKKTQQLHGPHPRPSQPQDQGVKRAREEEQHAPDTAAKAIKTEEGAGTGAAAAAAATGAHSAAAAPAAETEGGEVGDAWRMPIPLQDNVANVLVRLALLLLSTEPNAASRDEENGLQQQYALGLLGQAATVWPYCNMKVQYLERLLPTHMDAAARAAQAPQTIGQMGANCTPPPPMLTTSLRIVHSLVEARAPHLLQTVHSQVVVLVEPCQQTKSWPHVQELCEIVRIVCSWNIPEGQPGAAEVAKVWTDLEAKINQQMSLAAQDMGLNNVPITLNGHPQILGGLCCSLALLETLEPLMPAARMAANVPLLLRILGKAVKEMAHAAQMQFQVQAQAQTRRPIPFSTGTADGPEYGSLAWAIAACIRLCAPRVLHSQEDRKTVLASMVGMLVGGTVRYFDPAIFIEVLKVVGRWLVDPYPGQTGQLSLKEGVLLCQRIGMLERMVAITDPALRTTFESMFVQLVHKLCSAPQVPQDLREDAFTKVERMFMVGLRANNPSVRKDFFALYDRHVPTALFDRLQFIIFNHDWEAMANQFWLKHALDMVFSVLKEDEDLLLAFNTAQIPHLLPGIKQNTYSPSLHMQAKPAQAAPSQQQQQQQQQQHQQQGAPGGPANMEVNAKPEAKPEVKEEMEVDAQAPVKVEQSEAHQQQPQQGTQGPGQPATQTVTQQQQQQQQQGAMPPPLPASGPSTGNQQQGSGSGSGPQGDGVPQGVQQQPCAPSLSIPREVVPGPVMQMMQDHAAFLHTCGELKLKDMMHAVRECLHADAHMAYHLWVLMFPIVWGTMEKNQQVTLAKPIIALLSKEYHFKQSHLRPNVIQALLDGIAVSQPQPKIPPELIKFLGKTFNAWHIAIPLLESHVVMFPNDMRCFDALLELYKLVSEDDMLCGLWRRRCNSPVTKSALSLIQTGHLELAQELLGDATRAVPPDKVSRSEQAMWIQQWVNCAKNLSQWDMLEEYARETYNHELSLDCLWRLQDWMGLRQTLTNRVTQLEDSPQMLMIKSYMALQESDVVNSEARTNQATIAALLKWWQLPEVGCAPQSQLLQTFQQLVELREDVRVLTDLASGGARPDYPYQDLRDITDTWRLRIPNEWESMLHWQDLLMWRNHIYDTIITAFAPLTEANPQLHQLGYRDKAWSVNKLGAVATAHGHTDTCLHVLHTMYGFSAMEVQEAFVKIREQARAYLERPTELMAGLNLLSTTNLDYFGAQHQSEIFRLKGSLLAQMKDTKAAHQSFFQSLYLWKQSAEAWLGWGKLCDELWDKGASAGMPTTELLEYAVHCILQAVKLGHAPARGLLPRLLYLLSFDNNITAPQETQAKLQAQGRAPSGPWLNVVGQAMERSGALELAPWVWLPWLPNLQMALARPEASLVKQIIMGLALALPQAVYLPLRTFSFSLRESTQRSAMEMKERHKQLLAYQAAGQQAQALATKEKEEAAARGETGSTPAMAQAQQQAMQAAEHVRQAATSFHHVEHVRNMEGHAFEHGRQVNDAVREKYPHLTTTLDALATEVSTRFAARQEERLLAVVHALLHRCYKLPFAGQHEVPSVLKKELLGVCRACFQDSGSSGKSRRASSSSLREAFCRDMHPDNPNIPPTLEKLMEYLKAFRGRLLCEVEDKMSYSLRLEDEAPMLRDLPLVDIEMPGLYAAHVATGEPPPPDGTVLLEAFGAAVGIVRRAGSSHRRLSFICSDGHTRHMLVQQSQNNMQQSGEERILQLMRSLNRMLDAHPQSRNRALAWHVPMAVIIAPGTRLLEEDPSFITYGEAYEVNSLRYGREADMPINVFKKRCANQAGEMMQLTADVAAEQRLAAYHDVCERIVSENVFAQYVYKSLPSSNHLWAFKKTLCLHTALAGLLCHLLLLSGRTPFKVLIAKDTGRMSNTDFIPVYNERSGVLENAEAVPFRLTRNLQSFFSGFGVEGMFMMSMVNSAQAILHKNTNIKHVLALFFRDDIVAWSGRRGSSKNTIVSGLKNDMIKNLVLKNVGAALARLQEVAPSVSPENVQQVLMNNESSVLHGAHTLVTAATDSRNLCRMEATWHPWF